MRGLKKGIRKLPVRAALFGLVLLGAVCAQAYDNEVFYRNGYFRWRVDGTERGQSSDLATAINNGIAGGNRELHITTGGKLYSQINLAGNLTMYFHWNTLEKSHSGTGFYRDGSGGIRIYDLFLEGPRGGGMGFRTSRASDMYFQNVHITGGGIGIRVDSHPSRPYEDGRWVSNLTVQDCSFNNCGGHGLETYGVDGVSVSGISARDCGECGVLFNKTVNGWVGSVYAYRCCYGGGYAGLRFANDCGYMQVENSTSIECGRGIFILTGSHDIWIKNCYVVNTTDIGIWFQDVNNCTVDYGVNNSGTSTTGSGTWANTTGSYGVCRVVNRSTGKNIDGMGSTSNGASASQYDTSYHLNQYWAFIPVGSYYYLVNQGTGMKLDGYGRTANGSVVAQYSSASQHPNAQWSVSSAGSGYNYLINRNTGMRIDGYGYQDNGSELKQYYGTTHPNAQWSLQD